jgi:hypothetical protein
MEDHPMSVALTPDDPGFVDVHQLRLEAGWFDVAKALTRVFLGHLVIVGGTIIGIGIVVLVALSLAESARKSTKTVNIAFEFACWGGLGFAFLSVLYGYGMIFVGQWRCLKNAPERCGAKWLMLACITCLLMGPALNTMCSLGGVQEAPQFRKGPGEFKLPQFSPSVRNMQIAGTGIGMLSQLLFLWFLRSVARCFGDEGRMLHVTVFVIVQALLFGAVIYVGFFELELLFEPTVLIGLGIGGTIAFFWYLYLLVSVRRCIIEGMEYTHSPLYG